MPRFKYYLEIDKHTVDLINYLSDLVDCNSINKHKAKKDLLDYLDGRSFSEFDSNIIVVYKKHGE